MCVVVITGASSGIGRAAALAFARTGAGLVLASRGQEALRETMEACREHGSQAHMVVTDVTNEDSVRYLARVAAQTFGRIDVWINNAGMLAWGSVEEVPMSQFERVIQTDLLGYVHGARAVLPYFREQGHGILIDNVSMLGALPAPYAGAYVAAKHAVRGFDAVLRQELLLEGAHDIHVCTLMPRSVDTPLVQHASNPAARNFIPMPPIDPPERVAAAMVDLARRPRREVCLGGEMRLWRHRLSPGEVERQDAFAAERRTREPDTADRPSRGISFLPPPPWQELTHGGWRRRRPIEKTAVLGLAALIVWRCARRLAR
jgi:NAD(P)-dependent dehydrogenase (short-subunit alcohol dehydrogenase family)